MDGFNWPSRSIMYASVDCKCYLQFQTEYINIQHARLMRNLPTHLDQCLQIFTYVLTDEAAIYSKILMEHNLRPVWSDVRIKSSPILYTICTNTFLLRECFSNCVKSSTNIWASFKNRPIRSHCLRHINFICRASHVIDFCN